MNETSVWFGTFCLGSRQLVIMRGIKGVKEYYYVADTDHRGKVFTGSYAECFDYCQTLRKKYEGSCIG